MIELQRDKLVFRFPEVDPRAKLSLSFQRTLRIPDDDREWPLPPGLGRFPLRHVDDFAAKVPAPWLDRGGVMLPMYQSEALWLSLDPGYVEDHEAEWPFAIQIATGKVSAVTGKPWSPGLKRRPQDYLVAPSQPWLDGYCVDKGVIRQFVAMPLGDGYTAEEQLTGEAQHGGMQIRVVPMTREAFERRFPKVPRRQWMETTGVDRAMPCAPCGAAPDMGLAPGGRMSQSIEKDPYDLADWHADVSGRCFVHIANSLVWRQLTGEGPPTTPFTSAEYSDAGLPWFAWYDDKSTPLAGSGLLAGLKSVLTFGKDKGAAPLPENEAVAPERIVALRRGLGPDEVREGGW